MQKLEQISLLSVYNNNINPKTLPKRLQSNLKELIKLNENMKKHYESYEFLKHYDLLFDSTRKFLYDKIVNGSRVVNHMKDKSFYDQIIYYLNDKSQYCYRYTFLIYWDYLYESTIEKLSKRYLYYRDPRTGLVTYESFISKIVWTCGELGSYDGVSSYHVNYSDEFLFKFGDKLEWDYITCKRNMGVESIRYLSKYINWNVASRYRKMTPTLIREFSDKVNWDVICTRQRLTFGFVKSFKNKINITCLRNNIHIKFTKTMWDELIFN